MKEKLFDYITISSLNKRKIKREFDNDPIFKYVIIDNFIVKNYSKVIAEEHKAIP